MGDLFKATVDWPQLQSNLHDNFFHLSANVTKHLKDSHPEWIAPIIMMGLPRGEKPWGSCALRPKGLPLLRSATDRATKDL
eukprot:5809972-Pyramimonas_sp.AAC.1